MQKSNRREQLVRVLIALTLIASIPKVFIGLDYDENYITVLGGRLLQGDHLFRECWDLYQTTGLTMTLVLGIYHGITGSYEGAILFCRIITALIQLCLGYFLYRCLRGYYRNADFAGLFVANFLPRGTMNLEYGFLSCNYILVAMCLLLCYERASDDWSVRRRTGITVIAGVCFSMGMLSYPTMIISVPVLLLYFLKRRHNKPSFFCMKVFGITCLVCATIFFTYVFRFISVSEMLENIRNGILLDASHGNGDLLESLFSSLQLSRDKRIQVISLLGTSLIVGLLYWGIKKRWIAMVYHIMLTSSLVLIFANLSLIRPSGVYGFQIRYVMIVLFFIPTVLKKRDMGLDYLFYWMGIFMLAGTLLGSNLGIAENAGFLYLSMLMIILVEQKERYVTWAVVALISSIIVGKGFIVRVDGTSPSNILTIRERADFGPFAGIYLDKEQKEKYYIRKQTLDEYIESDDVMLVMSQDPAYNLMSEAKFTSATALTTPVYGKQWVEYYRNREYVNPTVILIDKEYFDLDNILYQTEFGNYIQELMDMDSLMDAEGFWIVRR